MSGNWSYSWTTAPDGTKTLKTVGNVPADILKKLQGGHELTNNSNVSKGTNVAPSNNGGEGKDYRQYGLELHNSYRARHGSPKMVLSDRLNKAADAYAHKLACQRKLVHNKGLDYGENLYISFGKKCSQNDSVRDACKSWYDEIKDYNFSRGGFTMGTGHFTAMVWKSSTELGIGISQVGDCVVVVGNYKCFPNMQGQFQSNVLPCRQG